MRLLSTGVAEQARNARWLIEKRLQVIEELASNPQATANPGPSEREAHGRLHRAESLGDRKAEDEVIVDLIRAQMWQWWPDLPERQLLVDLYRRAAQRNARRGSADSRRRPTHTEGLRVAKAFLTGVQGRSGLGPSERVSGGDGDSDTPLSGPTWPVPNLRPGGVHPALRRQPGLLRCSPWHYGRPSCQGRRHPSPARCLVGRDCFPSPVPTSAEAPPSQSSGQLGPPRARRPDMLHHRDPSQGGSPAEGQSRLRL